jgi:Fe-S-cluster containining protein
MDRAIHHRYVDPLDQIWLACASRLGLRVVRSADAYATYDPGTRTLAIADDASLDPDDCLGQMIFHELCHALVEGDDAFARPDWGLDNETDRDTGREHACLRVQAVLAARHGLRAFLAPTTDYRTAFWDRLPADPLADRDDPSVQAAILALRRAATPPWRPVLDDALAATARIAAAVAAVGCGAAGPAAPPLWQLAAPPPPPHPSGLPADPAPAPGRGCATCAWRHRGRGVERCRQAGGARVDPAWPACERWEPALACQACGACCRAAYHAVEVSRRDPVVRRQPGYLIAVDDRLELRRAGDRCAALTGGEARHAADGAPTTRRYACAIYDDRPRTCRDFTLGSEHCLTARRRVGLSL